MIPPVSGDALTALVERWRKKFPAMTAHKQSADDYWAGQCSGANKCADELEALIAAGRSAATTEPKQEHPPIHPDEAGDWAAANNGVGARIQMLERALGNCYMMSKREIARLLNRSPMDVGVKSDQLTLERWNHVKRFCEETGQKSSILRATLPTEITDGSGPVCTCRHDSGASVDCVIHKPAPAPLPAPTADDVPAPISQPMADAAEMLWVVLANVSGGDWTKQSKDWQEVAARWRDNYFAVLHPEPLTQMLCDCDDGKHYDTP